MDWDSPPPSPPPILNLFDHSQDSDVSETIQHIFGYVCSIGRKGGGGGGEGRGDTYPSFLLHVAQPSLL